MEVLASQVFKKQCKEMFQNRPVLRDKLAAFIKFRADNPTGEPFNSKDAMYVGNPVLKGIRHVHLWIGKAIVTYVYDRTSDTLRLIAFHEHTMEENTMGQRTLAMIAANDSEFEPFSLDTEEASNIDLGQIRSRVEDILFDLASTADDIFIDASKGSLDDLMEWIVSNISIDLNIDEAKVEPLVYQSFGGEAAFKTFLNATKKSYGIKESIRYWIDLVSRQSR